VFEEGCYTEHAILLSKSFLFVSGYFWHITDIHYDVHYSTSGDTRKCEYRVRIALTHILEHNDVNNMDFDLVGCYF
jgi:hypothetical protein